MTDPFSIDNDPTGHGNFFKELGDVFSDFLSSVLGQIGLRFNLNYRGDFNASLSDIRTPFSDNQYILASSHGMSGWDLGGGNYYQYLTHLGFPRSESDHPKPDTGKTFFVDEIMDTDFFREGKQARVHPGVHTFFAHGGVDYMNKHHFGEETVSLRAKDVTLYLKGLPEYNTIDTVVYSSCHSGEGPNSLAALSSVLTPNITFVGADGPVIREYGPVRGIDLKWFVIPFRSGKWNYYKQGKLIWSY